MSDLIAAAGAGVAVFLLVAGAGRAQRRAEAREALGRLHMSASPAPSAAAGRRALLAPFAERFAVTGPGRALSVYAAHAHPSRSFSDVVALGLSGIIGGAVAGNILFGAGPLMLLAAAGGPVVLDRVLIKLGGRRTGRLETQLPPALALQSSALRAGHSLVTSLRLIAAETKGPLGEETATTVREIDIGVDLEEALTQLAARAASRDAELWVTSMLVVRTTGGNLSTILDSLAERVRERVHVRNEVRALTAQARMSGLVVALAPVVFFLFLSMTSRQQMRVLYSTPLGLALLTVGIAMEAAGFVWIRRILKVKT